MNFKTGHLLSSDGSGFRVGIVDSFLDGLSENCHVPGIVRKHGKEKRLRQKRAVLMMWSTNSSQGSSSFLSSTVWILCWSTGNVATRGAFHPLFKVPAAVAMVTYMASRPLDDDDDGSLRSHQFNGPHQQLSEPAQLTANAQQPKCHHERVEEEAACTSAPQQNARTRTHTHTLSYMVCFQEETAD